MNQYGRYNRVFIETNKIATVFGRENFKTYIQKEISKGNLVRIKNRSTQASESTSLIDGDYSKNASKGSIHDSAEDVNKKISNTDSAGRELSEGQMDYFKDSKVRDDNGNLLVVYHGTRKADFTVFKRNINFFTDNKEMADSYALGGEMYEG